LSSPATAASQPTISSSSTTTSICTALLNSIDAKLNTPDLTAMNKSADIDKLDPADLAATWLKNHGF
jgi:glycine betaine/choline ABC-type transport system substrate-binding protein